MLLVRSVLIFVALISAVQLGFGQDSWEIKPVDEWTHKDVKDVLEKSAWGKVQNLPYRVLGDEIEQQAVVVLRSSLPIRLALFRKAQLDAGYDKMSEKEKSKFDKENVVLLNCPACKKFFIVAIITKNVTPVAKSIVNKYKKSITLSNDQGKAIGLAGYEYFAGRKQTEMMFFFPRPKSKGALLGDSVKELVFKLDFRVDRTFEGFPVREVKFSVPDLIRDGMVLF